MGDIAEKVTEVIYLFPPSIPSHNGPLHASMCFWNMPKRWKNYDGSLEFGVTSQYFCRLWSFGIDLRQVQRRTFLPGILHVPCVIELKAVDVSMEVYGAMLLIDQSDFV